MTNATWLNWAAVVTWLVVSLPTLIQAANGTLRGVSGGLFIAAFLLFGTAMVVCLWARPRSRNAAVWLVLVEAVTALAMIYTSRNGTVAATLVVVAAQLPYVMPTAAAWWWVAAQTALSTAIFATLGGWLNGLSASIAFGGFQAFAVATTLLALSERSAREELARANGELLAAQELLAESSRVAERLRISRDLHDTLGHHLTALSLQLDVASRLTSGQGAQHVLEAHAITKLLLSDVRDVVSQLRDARNVDLRAAITKFGSGTGSLQIHAHVDDAISISDPAKADALLRAVQEIITNTTRHAAAANLWIRVTQAADGLVLDARDDGRGGGEVRWGHGLTGMRERFEQQHGRLEVTTAAGGGFHVWGFIPA